MASPLAQLLLQAQQSDAGAMNSANQAAAVPLAQASQASIPQQPFRATVQPTDVEKAYNDYQNSMMQAYAAQLGQQNAMWGGLAGLGSAGISILPKMTGLSSLFSGTSAGVPDAVDALGEAALVGL